VDGGGGGGGGGVVAAIGDDKRSKYFSWTWGSAESSR
jgi:hypothetical protein